MLYLKDSNRRPHEEERDHEREKTVRYEQSRDLDRDEPTLYEEDAETTRRRIAVRW
jgi:hypothetical protein